MPIIRFTERPTFPNPWVEFERIRKGLDVLSRSYDRQASLNHRANVYPALNIYEEPDRLTVTAELPGVKIEDLDLSIEGETLTLRGKRSFNQETAGASYHRREIEAGSFSRAIALPNKVDIERLSATLVNGILTITLLKAAEVTPRRINITAD